MSPPVKSNHAGRRVRPATVIGRWGDDTVLLRLEDGRTVEAAVPDTLIDRWDVGADVTAHFVGNRLVGWQPSRIG